jgi:hypothetical protein
MSFAAAFASVLASFAAAFASVLAIFASAFRSVFVAIPPWLEQAPCPPADFVPSLQVTDSASAIQPWLEQAP